MSLETGVKLANKYEVVRAITSGGMGSIYEGRLIQDGRRVAIKQMLEHLMEGEQGELFKSKFQSEVAFLRTLNHPGIPRLYDSFVLDGVFYIVMEFIVGRNLEQELEERKQLTGHCFSMDQLVRDTRQVLEILQYLHNQTPPLVHRDVKPANLIREHPSGRIKLVDFGMARLLNEMSGTQTQLGTLGYSPLEQLQGQAEQRSDLYAVGATMHHLITGEVPRVLKIPPVLSVRPEVDPALAAIIDRACSPQIDMRFTDAGEMLRALDEVRPVLTNAADSSVKLSPLPRLDEPPAVKMQTSIVIPPSGQPLPPPPPLPEGEPAPPPPSEPVDTETELPRAPTLTLPEEQHETVRVDEKDMPAPPPALTPTQIIGAGSACAALAFLIGWGMGHRPGTSSSTTATESPIAVSTPTAAPVETSTPSPLAVVPVHPTPTPRATPKPTPKPVVKKPPPPPPPPPDEAPQHFSLDGPSYPTTGGRDSGNDGGVTATREVLTLIDASSSLQVDLDPSWSRVGRIEQQGFFARNFRKQQAGTELTFDIKGYTTENPILTCRNSFRADHTGWTNVTDLTGADVAFSRSNRRQVRFEWLVARRGHFYWFRFQGNGSGVRPELVRRELNDAWDHVQVVE